MIFIFFTAFVVPLLGWDVFLSSLNEWDFTNLQWKKSDGSTLINFKSCPSNGMELLCLDGDIQQAQTKITGLPPHFELKVLADLYYVASFDKEYAEMKIDSTLVFSIIYGWDVNMTYYNNQCGSWGIYNQLNIKTAVYKLSHTASSVYIYMSTNLDEAMPNEGYCFRNFQLLINPCHYSCLTCSAGLINNCLSCFDGTTPVAGKCPKCSSLNFSFQTSSSGCVQECTLTNYLADKNKFCQFNNRISVHSTSFYWAVNLAPFTYDWTLYNNGVLQSQRYFYCNSKALVGLYSKYEYITKSYSFISTTKQVRVRISHYMFNVWDQFSQIQLLMDGIQVSLIYMKDGIFRTINSNVISSSISQCYNLAINKNFYYYRTEQIIQITNHNPIFTLKSSQDLWSVRDISVDIIVCSPYCLTCLNDWSCSACQANYYLYKGQCISSCPEYSALSGVRCIDFDEETQFTNYIIKAFYSFNSQETETSLFNLISYSRTNFEKGNSIYFSYLKDRRIFGGALVWLNAKFGNTYTIPQSHYAVRVRMLVVLGDDFGNGKFQYQLNTNSVVTLTRASSSSSHSQQWGATLDEYFYQVNTLVFHSASSFSITVECIGDTTKAINQAFCGIANYFVTVLECQTFCDACTSISTCTSWSTTTANFDPITHSCFPGYSADAATKKCVADPDPVCGNGIVENNEQCDDRNLIPADGCFNCQYQCSSYYTNCINLNQNTCEFGYYLNLFDNICYPLCGDRIIVAEEQCDDGNLLPFDGCHSCLFSCQDSCKECTLGKCYQCHIGWNLSKQTGQCYSYCGDGIVNVNELCDDMNDIPFDGCYECHFQCDLLCTNCQDGVCTECNLQFEVIDSRCHPICGDSIIVGNEECEDGNLIPYDGCFECKFQCDQPCTDCQQGICFECNTLGYELIDNHCFPICGDSLIRGNEECDDGNLIPYDGCFECKFQCDQPCTDCQLGICNECITFGYELIDGRCLPICGDTLIMGDEECDDGNLIPYDGCFECKFQCDQPCTDCQFGICFECNTLGYELIDNHCFPICGDSLIRGNEECDDGNLIPYDGCFECKFQCDQPCTDCQFGICFECNTLGYELIDNQCFPICGDSLIRGNEDCDDGNLIPYDGCFECNFQCDEPCTDCQLGICNECNTLGYELIDSRCLPICGDSLIRGNEECDDGNIIPQDGCYECQFQCQIECTDCQLGICYDCDTAGWELQIKSSKRECHPICGDGLVMGTEECDDPDNLECQDCRYVCHEQCLDCNQGICLKCHPGWYNKGSQCYSICGDGYKSETEDCDDFNNNDFDGCSSNCEIEAQWICELYNHLNVCSHVVVPSFKLEHQFNQSATQQIKIGFTNAMMKHCNFEFKIEIDECENNTYSIQKTSLVPAQYNELWNIAELVEIQFNKSCTRPRVKISLNDTQCLSNFYEQEVNPPTEQIIFQQINILSEDSRQKAIRMVQFNTIIFSSYLSLIGLSILTGGLNLLGNMLDLLQYYSYMRLINVPFPQNLELYLESFKIISIQPLLDLLQIDKIINLVTGGVDLPFIQCNYKFSELNGLFIWNAQSIIFVLMFSSIIYLIQRIIFKYLKNISLQSIMKRKLKYANLFIFTRKIIFRSIISFYDSQLLRILIGCAYDLNFSIFLQLSNFNQQTQFLAFNSIFSLIVLLSYLVIVYSLFQYQGNKYYTPLVEGIKPNSHFWGKEFNCLQFLKKTIFMFFLVCLPVEPIIQCLLISLLCLLNTVYINLTKPLINKYEYYQVILSESIFCFSSLTFILYEIHVSIPQLFSDQVYQILGWLHISLISAVLSINLLFDIKQQIQKYINYYRKEKIKKLKNMKQILQKIQHPLFF